MIARQVRLGALVAGAVVVAAWAPSLVDTLTFQGGSRVWVEGTSTVRGWRCESTAADGSVAAEGAPAPAQVAQQVRTAQVAIPVATLDCRNATMNGHMRRALKSDANPAIRFRMSGLQPGQGAGTVRMNGTLSIAGTERPVAIDAAVAPADGGGLRVSGRKALQMTEFGVTPPSLMMGTMKVRDQVTVGFDVVVK